MAYCAQRSNALNAYEALEISKLCHCTRQTFEFIGNFFISAFSKYHSAYGMGSALAVALGECAAASKVRQRLILIYLIYRANDLDVQTERRKQSPEELIEEVMWHPFLAYLIFLMEGERNEEGAKEFNSSFPSLTIGPQERFLIGCLLTGRYEEIATRTPLDIAHMVIHTEENFDLSRHKTRLKQQQSSYPAVAKASVPALLKMPEETKAQDSDDPEHAIVELLTGVQPSDVLPPPFHRVTPTLMPPSDDEFQFLYPFMLEPLWMDAETLKTDLVGTNLSHLETLSLKPVVPSSPIYREKAKSTEPDSLLSAPLKLHDGFLTKSPEISEKLVTSLPATPTSTTPDSSDEAGLNYSRCSSSCSLPLPTPSNSSSSVGISSTSSPKPPLLYEEAVKSMKKAMKSVVKRSEAYRLAEAISLDPSIALECCDLPLDSYVKFIDDNPTVAAAVIFERIKKNSAELPIFFNLITKCNLTVQGMEVVNKLCTQIDFPQELVNNFISACVCRCDDTTLTQYALCRQVRMICVFLSSLLRNSKWNVQPLSVELQSFALKYAHVKEAVSLYQSILLALQPETPKRTDSQISVEPTA